MLNAGTLFLLKKYTRNDTILQEGDATMEENRPDKIDYFIYEGALARAERNIKRWVIACVLLFIALVGTNIGWIVYENQFEDVTMTQEATTDGGGDVVINGTANGDVNYGESDTDN